MVPRSAFLKYANDHEACLYSIRCLGWVIPCSEPVELLSHKHERNVVDSYKMQTVHKGPRHPPDIRFPSFSPLYQHFAPPSYDPSY